MILSLGSRKQEDSEPEEFEMPRKSEGAGEWGLERKTLMRKTPKYTHTYVQVRRIRMPVHRERRCGAAMTRSASMGESGRRS